VVGSGPAGATAALRLCQAGFRPLLLDSGSERSALGLTVRLCGFTVLKYRRPLKKRELVATGDPTAELFEDLAAGGLTNHWSCAVPRFAPEDFADAERAGEVFRWPIGYDDVAPWYDEVEPLLHIAGSPVGCDRLPAGKVRHARRLPADWEAVGHQAQSSSGRAVVPMPYAYGSETSLTASGTVFNSFVRVARPEIRAGRLDARYRAHVVRLEWSPRSKRVEAVVVRDPATGSETRLQCRAVVLAAGAVNTTEILLASTCPDFPNGLGNTDGVLGRYLHDHPLGKLILDLSAPISIHPPSYLTRPALDRTPPLYAAACMQWSGTDALAKSILRGRAGRLEWVGFNVFGTMAPSHDGFMSLDADRKGRDGRTGIALHVRHPPEAKTALESARDDLISALGRAGLSPRLRVWHVEPVGNSKHFGGTCRMHASPRFGMLDGWSRLHAVRNVAIADSAAFTTGPEKNPVLTAMALAARAASRLADELKAGDL